MQKTAPTIKTLPFPHLSLKNVIKIWVFTLSHWVTGHPAKNEKNLNKIDLAKLFSVWSWQKQKVGSGLHDVITLKASMFHPVDVIFDFVKLIPTNTPVGWGGWFND